MYDNGALNSDMKDISSFLILVLFACIVGPIFEEFIFRFPLKLKKSSQSIFFIIYISLFVVNFTDNYYNSGYTVYIQLIAVLFSFYYFAKLKFNDSYDTDLNVPIILLSSIVFIALHSRRFILFNSFQDFVAICIANLLLHVITTVYFVFLRLRYKEGFSVSVLAHGLINFLPLFIIYLDSAFK